MINDGNKIAKIFLIVTIIILIISNLGVKTPFDNNKINSKVTIKMADQLSRCGEGYFLSFITVDDGFFKKKFSFVEEITMTDIGAVSIKFRNPHWGFVKDLDKKSYTFLNSKVNNGASYYNNLELIDDIPVADSLLNHSKIKPKYAGFSLVKKYNNIIYVFILTSANEKNQKCKEVEAISILNELSIFTQQLL